MAIRQSRVCDVPRCEGTARHFQVDADDGDRWEADLCAGHFDIVLSLPWNQVRPSARSEAVKQAASKRRLAAYNRSLRVDGHTPELMG